MSQELRQAPGYLGMKLLLLSLSVLFAASLVGILVVRLRAPQWPPEGAPGLPTGLWLSTVVIVASSWTLSRAQRRVRLGEPGQGLGPLTATGVLALVFLGNQVLNWAKLVPAQAPKSTALYGFSFLLLTVLHALHVLGGLVSLAVVTFKARAGSLTAAGLTYASLYWHFLTVVWLVIFAFLELLF